MTTFVLIPGATGDAWYWHRVVPLLRARGHDVVAPDLPARDETAGLDAYVETVERGIGDRRELVVVGQSMGALTAPLVCARRTCERLVLVAPMIAAPGETGHAWWSRSGQAEAERAMAIAEGRDPDAPFDPVVTFLHDVPEDVIAASATRSHAQSSRPFDDPWPLASWPEVETQVVAGTRDRLFPIDFVRRLAKERLGVTPIEIDAGHLIALAKPEALAAVLLGD